MEGRGEAGAVSAEQGPMASPSPKTPRVQLKALPKANSSDSLRKLPSGKEGEGRSPHVWKTGDERGVMGGGSLNAFVIVINLGMDDDQTPRAVARLGASLGAGLGGRRPLVALPSPKSAVDVEKSKSGGNLHKSQQPRPPATGDGKEAAMLGSPMVPKDSEPTLQDGPRSGEALKEVIAEEREDEGEDPHPPASAAAGTSGSRAPHRSPLPGSGRGSSEHHSGSETEVSVEKRSEAAGGGASVEVKPTSPSVDRLRHWNGNSPRRSPGRRRGSAMSAGGPDYESKLYKRDSRNSIGGSPGRRRGSAISAQAMSDAYRSIGTRSDESAGMRSPTSSKGSPVSIRAGAMMGVSSAFSSTWLQGKGDDSLDKSLEQDAKNQSEEEYSHGCDMCQAVAEHDEPFLKELAGTGFGVNCVDYDWRSALHIACCEGHLDMVRFLVEQGAIVHRKDRWGSYPLKIAIREGHSHVRDFLVGAGAQLVPEDLKQVSMQLSEMSSRGDLEAVKSLIENMASLHATDFDKRSPLHLPSAEGHAAVVEFLIESKAEVNAKDRWGGVPLKDAIRGQHKEVQTILRAAGAKSWVPGNQGKARRGSLGNAVHAVIKIHQVEKAIDSIHQAHHRTLVSDSLHYPEDVKKLIVERRGTMSFVSNLARALGRRAVYDPESEMAIAEAKAQAAEKSGEYSNFVATFESGAPAKSSDTGSGVTDSPRKYASGEASSHGFSRFPSGGSPGDVAVGLDKGKRSGRALVDGDSDPGKSKDSSLGIKKGVGRMTTLFKTSEAKRKDSVKDIDGNLLLTMDIRTLAMNMEKKEEMKHENDLYGRMMHWKFWDRLQMAIKQSVTESEGREDASAFQMVMTFATAFALWGSDLYILFGPPFGGSDHGFYVALTIAFLLFVVELGYNLTYKTGYFGSFYFYIDFISAFSLLPEVALMFEYDFFQAGDSTSDTIQKSGLAARAGFRTGRIVRVLRIFKLVRIFKILAIFSRSAKRMKEQTVLGQLIHMQLQQKMVLLIVALLLLVGVIDTITDVDSRWPLREWTGELTGLTLMLTMSGGDIRTEPFRSAVLTFVVKANCEDPRTGGITRMSHIPNPRQVPGYNIAWIEDRRFNGEKSEAWCYIRENCLSGVGGDGSRSVVSSIESLGIGKGGDTDGCRLKFLRVAGRDIFGQGPSRLAWMPQLRVLGTQEALVMYGGGTDALCPYTNISEARVAVAEELSMGTVTDPVSGVEGDPCSIAIIDILFASKAQSLLTVIHVCFLVCLLAFSDSSLNRMIILLVVEPIGQMVAMVQGLAENPMIKLRPAELPGASTETKMVARALVQLSAMLQIAFEEAGSHIISHNITSVDNIDALVPGKKVRAIFGFCDVRRFTDCTECFQAEVLVFMNRIADFAHVSVHENHGHATMNLGDAFQFAWLLHEGQYGMKGESASEQKAMVADCALRAMLRVILETSCDAFLMRMSAHPELQKRMKGYVASSGFGLHSGWAIQGAIGSESKIDTIYLSSHVKWAERLESATKHYGVLILMSDSHYDLLSPRVQALCRRVDRIKVMDNAAPIDLYTYGGKSGNASDFFTAFPPKTSAKWRASFATALTYFLDGEWEAAQACLEECLAVHKDDGPSKAILRYMADLNHDVPFDWKGYREVEDI